MTRYIRIVGLITVESWSFTIERDVSGGGYGERTVTIPDGTYSPDELVAATNTAIQAADDADEGWGTGELSPVTLSLSTSTGVFTWAASTDDFTITWDVTDLRDYMRFSGSTLSFADILSKSGSRAHQAGFYPQLAEVFDDRTYDEHTSTSRADDGSTDTVHYEGYEDHEILVWLSGHYHSDSYSEYHDLRDLMCDHAADGRPLRVHWDRTITDPYAEVTEPYGYEDFIAGPECFPFRTERIQRDFVTWSEYRMKLYVEV